MEEERCPEHALLQGTVLAVLEKIMGITTAQLRAFQEGDHRRFTSLDKALEMAVGEKERSIGALRQHVIDHKCQKELV